MRADVVRRCRVRPCKAIKGVNNHWFVARIDNKGLHVHRFTEKEASRHGAIEVCSENCLHRHISRWAAGEITADQMPDAPSEALIQGDELTVWVSSVYRTNTQFGPARIVNAKQMGREASYWCFNAAVFEAVELTAGTHATFKTQIKEVAGRSYRNIVDVISIDGQTTHHATEAICNS